MKYVSFVVFLCVILFSATPALGDAVSNIQFDPGPVASMKFGDNINVSFDFEVTTPGGVRIYARPVSGGFLAPNYSAHGSPLYPVGSGAGTGYFTILSGEVALDDVRFQVWTGDNEILILEFFVPVTYYYCDYGVYNIQMDPASPSSLKFQENVNISFDYATDEPGGVRIYPRPFSDGDLTPNYGAGGSLLYPPGVGSGNNYFFVYSGEVTIDQIRFQVYDQSNTTLLHEFFIPVVYQVAPASVTDIVTNPASPAGWIYNEDISIGFNYAADEAVRIWARPMTDGNLTPNYAASGSPLYPAGVGSGSGDFTITSGEVTVDQISFRVESENSGETLLTYYVPVNFHFSQDAVVFFEPEQLPPAYLTCEHDAIINFQYYVIQPDGARIWAHPYAFGEYSPGGYYEGSVIEPAGWGSTSRYIGQNSPGFVNGVFWIMRNDDQSETYLEWIAPIELHFGNTMPSAVPENDTAPISCVMFEPMQNPINIGTTLRYMLPASADVTLRLFDIEGREVAKLVDEYQDAGLQSIAIETQAISSGIFFCRLDTKDADGQTRVDLERLVVLK